MGIVKDIEFSGSTYQVLVQDTATSEEFWVFIQLDPQGQIKDAFCSCEETLENTTCPHLETAYKSLFGFYSQPLHQRFANSLWNKLCRIYSDRLGDEPSLLTVLKPGRYVCFSHGNKIVFTIEATTPLTISFLENLVFHRPQASEDSSLSFSNLPIEEIELWREGRPSSQLRYDLSFWSDLAKWLMKMEEEGASYAVSFKPSLVDLPNWIQIDFRDIELGFYLSQANWPSIIPFLTHINSPLRVMGWDEHAIASITYDKKSETLYIVGDTKAKEKMVKQVGIQLNGWRYVPEKGFYAEEPHILLKNPILKGEELSQALTEHGQMIGSLLVDATVHPEPFQVSYQLMFDSSWNLHVVCYLFEPGDLTKGYSRIIGDWAYLEDDGFYYLEGRRFNKLDTVIRSSQVSDFVIQNRSWLNHQEGFHTHVRSMEYQMTYLLGDDNRLTFVKVPLSGQNDTLIQDFGAWIYVEGYGFYSKTAEAFNFLLRPGISISQDQIPLFIKMNKQELSLISGFFASTCPVIKTNLSIRLIKQGKLLISPSLELMPSYANKKLRFFDDLVYVEGEGFSEIPPALRLPEKFSEELEMEEEELTTFLLNEYDSLQHLITSPDPHLVKPSKIELAVRQLELDEKKGKGWYRLSLSYKTEHGMIQIIPLWDALKNGARFAFFPAGLIDLHDSRFDWLRQLRKENLNKKTGKILVSTLEFMRLNAFEPVHLLEEGQDNLEATRAIFKNLIEFHNPEEPHVEELKSHLRPYQEVGVRWLWFLYQQQLSGLLCDDMGLGKTHQAMALLASVRNFCRNYAEGSPCYFLVVCPTSVIHHWEEKLHQFLPGVRVCTFYGTKRSLVGFEENYDVLITSYGILRNEQPALAQLHFEVAVFDELQIAKNQSSLVYAALRKIKAHMKLGLTGTPIENRLRELKSLFDIVLPSYMPGETSYREFFVRPIEKEQNRERKDLLNRLIKPFIMRRKKGDVLTDLPEKIEEVSHCDLSSYQHQLYTEVLELRRRHIMEDLQSDQESIPYLHIFALLSCLKQICDHPAVYLKQPKDYRQYASGKWNLFLELLREARESGQKVVVFSQYLGMLDIIEHELKDQQIGYASVRGSTTDRKGEIHRFNEDPACEVFVGSLQAAGLGVDLTAGSVVIHYDRWWNKAREDQATDRVHRIGQTRGVQVFKLVTKGTFEEKIDEMIEKKGKLMEEVVGVDDQDIVKRFTKDELLDLLNFVKKGEEEVQVDEET